MNRFTKWLLFTALLAAYLWAVFFWDRFPHQQQPHSFQDAEALSQTEEEDSELPMAPDTFAKTADTFVLEEPVVDVAPEVPEFQVETDEPFWVIGGSFSSEERAIQEQVRLENKYIPSELVFMDPYYRLVLGKHRYGGPAQSMVLDMKALGVDAFVMEMQ